MQPTSIGAGPPRGYRWHRVFRDFSLFAVALLTGCSAPQPDAKTGTRPPRTSDARIAAAVRAVLDQQVAAWNRGDIDAFMTTYWPSADLTFSGAGQIRRGWTTVRDRYKAHYSTPEKMGRLTFSEIEVRPLSDAAALVLGHWRLTQTPEAGGGVFTLVFQRIDGHWLIVHDHTSAEPAPAEPKP